MHAEIGVCIFRYLHMQGIIHRDIKPDNLLIVGDGWRNRKSGRGRMLKIADFGTSCFCEGDNNAQKWAPPHEARPSDRTIPCCEPHGASPADGRLPPQSPSLSGAGSQSRIS